MNDRPGNYFTKWLFARSLGVRLYSESYDVKDGSFAIDHCELTTPHGDILTISKDHAAEGAVVSLPAYILQEPKS